MRTLIVLAILLVGVAEAFADRLPLTQDRHRTVSTLRVQQDNWSHVLQLNGGRIILLPESTIARTAATTRGVRQ